MSGGAVSAFLCCALLLFSRPRHRGHNEKGAREGTKTTAHPPKVMSWQFPKEPSSSFALFFSFCCCVSSGKSENPLRMSSVERSSSSSAILVTSKESLMTSPTHSICSKKMCVLYQANRELLRFTGRRCTQRPPLLSHRKGPMPS